jgi:hypothetical protein
MDMGVRDYDRTDYDRDEDRTYVRWPERRRFSDERTEAPEKEPLGKREPVRIAGAVATLVTAGAFVLFGVEVTAEQQTQIRELVLLAIPIIVPIIASFEVARSKVDSPAMVERRLREERQR